MLKLGVPDGHGVSPWLYDGDRDAPDGHGVGDASDGDGEMSEGDNECNDGECVIGVSPSLQLGDISLGLGEWPDGLSDSSDGEKLSDCWPPPQISTTPSPRSVRSKTLQYFVTPAT